jgi:hypothetical protein
MSYEKKLERANELHKIIKDAEAELAGIFGETPKRKWTRRTTPDAEPPTN